MRWGHNLFFIRVEGLHNPLWKLSDFHVVIGLDGEDPYQS